MGKKAVALAPGLVVTKAQEEPESPALATSAKADATTAPLNFRVPIRFKQQFRIQAAQQNMNLTEFLTALLELWMRENRTGSVQ